MSNPLAPNVFSAGPKDKLAAADVYNVSTKTVVNSIQSISAKLGVDLGGLLNFGKGEFDNILTNTLSGVGIDKAALTARLLGTSSSLKSSFAKLEGASKDTILGSFADSGQLKVQLGAVESLCKSSDFNSISSLGSFVNEYTKTTLYNPIDNDAISTLLAGVMKEGAALGMNGLYGTLTTGITDNNLLSQIIGKSVPGLIKGGDLHSLSSIASSFLGKSLDFIYPNFANDIAKAFGFKGLLDVLAPHADYQAILTILGATNSNWDAFSRENLYSGQVGHSVDNGVSIVKLQNASQDFRTIILAGIKTEADGHRRKMYAFAQFYRRTVMADEIHRYFPLVALPPSQNQSLNTSTRKNKVVDPRVLVNMTAKALNNINLDFF